MTREQLSREEKKARTRAQLLEAAAKVFLRQGFFVASVDDVADEAGFTKGAVYAHFGSKEELFLALVQERIHERVLRIADLVHADTGVGAQAVEAGEQFLNVFHDEREWMLLTLEFWACATRNPELQTKFADRHRDFRAAVARLIEDQAERLDIALPLPADRLATGLMAIGNGFMLEKLADPEGTPDELFGEMLSIVFGVPVSSAPKRSLRAGGPNTQGRRP